MLYEQEMHEAQTPEEYIRFRWKAAFEVMQLLPDEKPQGYKLSTPAFIRPYDEDYFREWGQGCRIKPEPCEIDMAVEAMQWMMKLSSRKKLDKRRPFMAVVTLVSIGQSFGDTAHIIKERERFSISKTTVKRWFDQALTDAVELNRG